MISTIKSVTDGKQSYLLEVLLDFRTPWVNTLSRANNEDKATAWQHLLPLDQSSCQCRERLAHAGFIAKQGSLEHGLG